MRRTSRAPFPLSPALSQSPESASEPAAGVRLYQPAQGPASRPSNLASCTIARVAWRTAWFRTLAIVAHGSALVLYSMTMAGVVSSAAIRSGSSLGQLLMTLDLHESSAHSRRVLAVLARLAVAPK